MPKFSSGDELEVISNFQKAGIDIFRQPIAHNIALVNDFIYDMGIKPSEQVDAEALDSVITENNKYYRRYHNGSVEEIDKQTFSKESVYNYLPRRFRTYRPVS